MRSWFGPDFVQEAERAIHHKWQQHLSAAGPLGLKTGPVQVHEHTVTQQFGGGVVSVQDAATTGIIQRRVQLMYEGMHCFGETGGAGDDEMYAVIAVYPPDRGDQHTTPSRFPTMAVTVRQT